MINKHHGRRESNENIDHDGSLINQSSSKNFQSKNQTTKKRESKNDSKNDISNQDNDINAPNSRRSNSHVNEIDDIVQTITEAVFYIIDNNFDQLVNRSSNALGMRVKDSLILKVQQTNRKEIYLSELERTLGSRLIVDDDLQISFLPRIESPAPSSVDSENLSTRQKKSVSLAEEVKVFNHVENEFFTENEIRFFNESMDTQDDGNMDEQRISEGTEKIYNLNSRTILSPTAPLQSESFFSNEYKKSSELRTSSEDLKKFNSPVESSKISFNFHCDISDGDEILEEPQTNYGSTWDNGFDVRNFSIAPFANRNQIIVGLVETTSYHNSSKINEDESVSQDEKTAENFQMELIDHERKIIMSQESEIVKEDNNKSEETIPSVNKCSNSLTEDNIFDQDAIKARENQESPINSEKRSSLFSRIVRSKNRAQQNIPPIVAASENTESEKENEIQGMGVKNSKENLITREKDQRHDSEILTEIEPEQVVKLELSDEELRMKSLFDTGMDSRTNSHPSNKKTFSKVLPKSNKLSEKSSGANSSENQQSTNDLCSEETQSKVFESSSKSSGKLSGSDIRSVVINRGSYKPEVKTSLVSFKDKKLTNKTEISANENEPKSPKKSKGRTKRSGSSLKKIQAQVYPVAADNFLQSDPLGEEKSIAEAKVPQHQNINDGIDKMKTQTNRSRWSLLSKKSSAKMKSDEQEIEETESLNGNKIKDSSMKQIKKKKSTPKVASEVSIGGNEILRDNSQPGINPGIIKNESSKPLDNFEDSGSRKKSRDTLISSQLYSASVNLESEEENQLSKSSVNSENIRSTFMQGLKRSLRSQRKRSKKSKGKSETRLEVSTDSQTHMNAEFTAESSSELRDGNDSEKLNESSQLLDTKLSQSSSKTLFNENEDIHPKQKSRSFIKFWKQSTEGRNEVSGITDRVENLIRNPTSIASQQSDVVAPENIVGIYSVAVDGELERNPPSIDKITSSSSKLNCSQDLVERNGCSMTESDTKSSEHSESKPGLVEIDNSSPKVNKSLSRLLQRMSLKNVNKDASSCKSERKGKTSKKKESTMGNEFSKEMEVSEESVGNCGQDLQENSGLIESQRVPEIESRKETNEIAIKNSLPVFSDNEKLQSVVMACAVESLVQDQPEMKNSIKDEGDSDESLIKNATSDESMKVNKKEHRLFSSIKSIFKSPNKSESQRYPNTDDPEKTNIVNRSLQSLTKNDKLGASVSEIEVEKEESVDLMRKSAEMSTIQSMKSLQDNRKRSKNRRRSGHKLFDDKDAPFVDTKSLVKKSHQSNTSSDFMQRENEEDTEGIGVDDKQNSSRESFDESKTAIVSNRKKKSKEKENLEGNTKKFAISLSRIFSNSSRKRTGAKESRATANSQTNPEEHFEITKIPLSSSDDSSTQENEFRIKNRRYDVREMDNREELVAVKSLDSIHDMENKLADNNLTVKSSSKVYDRLYSPEQSGTVIFSAQKYVSQKYSENQLEKKNSLTNVDGVKKHSEKVFVTKGTIVSYAPMVESAKYISDEPETRSNEDEQSENRQKRLSGKSFATIRKLFSRASMRSRQNHVATEDHPDHQEDHEANLVSSNSRKSSIIKRRKDEDRSIDHSDDVAKRDSAKNDEFENRDRKTHPKIKKQRSKSKEKIRQPENIEDFNGSVIRDEILLVNNVAINKCKLEDCEDESKPEAMKSNESEIIVNQVELSTGGLKPTEIAIVDQKSSQKSSKTKMKGSLLSMVKSHNKTHVGTGKDEAESMKRPSDEELITSSRKDSTKTFEELGVPKSESIFSRGLKKMFKKRSSVVESVASDNKFNDPDIKTLQPNLSMDDNTDAITETEAGLELRNTKSKEIFDDVEYAVVYSSDSGKNYPAGTYYEESCQRPEDKKNELKTSKSKSRVSLLKNIARKSVDALSRAGSRSNKHSTIKSEPTIEDAEIESSATPAIPRTDSTIQDKSEDENRTIIEESMAEDRTKSEITSEDFSRPNPSFVNRRSTIVMMATPDPPRREQKTEDSDNSNNSRDGSSSSPTAFYYLLGPSLDEALVDVRVVFQNLIDKITGRNR